MLLGPSLLQVNGLKGLFIVEAVMRPAVRDYLERSKSISRESCVLCCLRIRDGTKKSHQISH